MSEATQTVAAGQLRSIIERIERRELDKQECADDIKAIKAEAKGTGFSVPTINAILKLRKKDQAEREEAESLLDIYLVALGMKAQGELFDEDTGSHGRADRRDVSASLAHGLGSDGQAVAMEQEEPPVAGESIDNADTPETATQSRLQTSSGRNPGSAGAPSPTSGEMDLGEAGTAQKRVVLPQEPCKADDGRDVEAAGGAASVVTNFEQAPSSSQASCAGPGQSPANRPGPATNLSKAERDRILRPSCQHPGTDHCGGSGTKHCHSCKVAAEQREVA